MMLPRVTFNRQVHESSIPLLPAPFRMFVTLHHTFKESTWRESEHASA